MLDYLSGGGSGQSIAVKYGIHAESTVLKWVKQYNSHEELTDSRKTGGYLMTKGIEQRRTTMEERIRIVEYCISHSNDYASAAKEFNCYYGQADTILSMTIIAGAFLPVNRNTVPACVICAPILCHKKIA